MNYWLAETTNLAECVEPLVRLIDDDARARPPHGEGALRRPRLDGAHDSQPVGLHVAGLRGAVGAVSDGRAVALPAFVGALRVRRRQGATCDATGRR